MRKEGEMNYQEWLETVPKEIRDDALWRVRAYQLALFVADLGWNDATILMRDKRSYDLSSQLYRALGSIGANIAEGFSRGTGRDRARFYEYALGSARESRGWYYQGRHILGEEVTSHRLELVTEIIRLLLTMVPQQRGRVLYEDSSEYQTYPNGLPPDQEDFGQSK
jgi:four helix bundle protein